MPNDSSSDPSLKDEVARLILRFGKPAVIEELERISREGRRRGAKEQEDDSNLYEMARIIAHAEYMGTKDFPIGRAARTGDGANDIPGDSYRAYWTGYPDFGRYE